jgi:hypothetical protein
MKAKSGTQTENREKTCTTYAVGVVDLGAGCV